MKQILTAFRDHHFYIDFLGSPSCVIDLGAHKGEFSLQITEHFCCRCYAVEANPELFSRIPEHKGIKKFNLCICEKDSEVPFYLSQELEASSIYPALFDAARVIKVKGITFERLLELIRAETVDLLKVDIEGAEIPLFQSMEEGTLRKIKQITVEFHDFLKKSVERGDVQRVMNHLKKSGFFVINFNGRDDHMDMLFINKAYLTFSDHWELLFFKYVRLNVRKAVKRYRKWKTGEK